MNTGPSDGRRRSSASLTMYDPARDIFTTPEDLHRATPNEAHPGDNQQAKVAQPSQADDVQDKDGASTAPPVEQTFPSRANDGGPVSSKLDASHWPDQVTTTTTDSTPSAHPVTAHPNEDGGSTASVSRSTQLPQILSSAEQSALPPLLTPTLPSALTSATKEEPVMPQISENESGEAREQASARDRKVEVEHRTSAQEHQEQESRKRKAEDPADQSSTKQGKPSDERHSSPAEKPKNVSDLPSFKRKRTQEKPQATQKRTRTPPAAYSRRDRSPPRGDHHRRSPEARRRARTPTPPPIRRTPSPSANEPVRQRKRPGGASRISAAEKEAIRRRQEERERERGQQTQQTIHDRGVQDVVRQHYNAVPERGRDWRKTDSKIKGLRSFNNWIKSTIIQKFSPDEDYEARDPGRQWGNGGPSQSEEKRLLVLDMGCGKGGDLQKWQSAPQPVDLYVGLDPADVSIDQARDRYATMRNPRGNRGRRPQQLYQGEFFVKDCFGESIGDISLIQQVGIDLGVGPGGSAMSSRWGGGGFDVVTMMFCMHYAFETEAKARQMLKNVAGSLKKGGRFIGVIPNSDVLTARVTEFHEKQKVKMEEAAAKKEAAGGEGQADAPEDGEVEDAISTVPEWGNSIYKVRFPGDTPKDGIFRPAFGWKYSYFLEEAVEEVPEYVVPWEAFRAMTEDYNLELQYRRPFADIWNEEKDDRTLGPLSERMGVRERDAGPLRLTSEEFEAASFYHAFCFYKV